jgi:integrase
MRMTLTSLDALRTLCAGGTIMKTSQGAIRAKGTCSKCGEKFTEFKGIGFLCPEHDTVPKRLYVDMFWKGERIRIFSDKSGKPLDTYERATEVLKHLNYEITNHVFDPKEYLKVEASQFWTSRLLDRFEKDKLEGIAPSYQRGYRRMVLIARDFFKTMDVREIRKVHVINYIDHCRKSFEWSDKTLKNTVDLFKTFMNYLHDDLELISSVPSFPVIDVQEKAFKWVSADDQSRLFELVPDAHKPIIAFLMLHACRPAEGRALKCKDVNLEAGSITISATFSGNVYRQRRKGRKAKYLVLPIHPEMREYIEEKVNGNHPEAFVFVNSSTGDPYSAPMIGKIWKGVRDEAGIGPYELRLYDASRHSVASQLVNSGATLFTVSKILGHSSTKMSEKYAHADLEKLRIELSRVSLKKRQTVTIPSLAKKRDTE